MGRDQQSRGGKGRNNGGRGGQRGRGTGGRAGGRGGRSSKGQTTLELKFAPHTQGTSKYATYATVKEAVMQQVQKTFKGGNDIAHCLKDLKEIDLKQEEPKRAISEE